MSDRRNYAKPTVFTYTMRNGRVVPLRLPMKKAVCPLCEGRGKYVNPAIDEHGISPDEFREDPEFAESYMSGLYDITCGECNGANVVDVIDEEKISTSSQKRRFKLFVEQQEQRAEWEAESRREQYWESGGQYGSAY